MDKQVFKRKGNRKLCLILCSVIVAILFLIYCSVPTVTRNPVIVQSSSSNYLNNMQHDSTVFLTAHENKLLFSVKNPLGFRFWKYCGNLLTIEDGRVSQVLLSVDPLFASGHTLYSLETDEQLTEHLVCYDLNTNQSAALLNRDDLYYQWSFRNLQFSADGTIFVLLGTEENAFVYGQIMENSIGQPDSAPISYALDGIMYTVDNADGNMFIVCDDAQQQILLDEKLPQGDKQLIPVEQGLLVYNTDKTDLLYLISRDTGDIIELFANSERDSYSALNIYGDYVYLSVTRYDIGQLGKSLLKSDPISGTYRICLTDRTTEKISDKSYRGLYIFDDAGIYACDENCGIYLLDFEGNILRKIIQFPFPNLVF